MKILKKYQTNFAKKYKSCCIEGRDISTKILPNSNVKFLRVKMYNNKKVLSKNTKGQKIIKYLFAYICKNPKKFIKNQKINKDKFRSVSDFISGMTDRYAINLYNNLK